MEKIVVICGAGASSTFLVHFMRRDVRSRDLSVSVEARSLADLGSYIDSVDVVLVGAHFVDDFTRIERAALDAGARAALLPTLTYDAAGARIALELALALAPDLTTPATAHQSGRTHG